MGFGDYNLDLPDEEKFAPSTKKVKAMPLLHHSADDFVVALDAEAGEV